MLYDINNVPMDTSTRLVVQQGTKEDDIEIKIKIPTTKECLDELADAV